MREETMSTQEESEGGEIMPIEMVTIKVEPVESEYKPDCEAKEATQHNSIYEKPQEVTIKVEPSEATEATQYNSVIEKPQEVTIKVEPSDVFKQEPDHDTDAEDTSKTTENNADQSEVANSQKVLPSPSPATQSFRNECSVCHKTLATPSGLQRHMANHQRESFTCKYCSRQFFKVESLEKHLKVHEKPTSYECDICKKSFTSQSNMRQHKKLHLDVKPYHCDTCQRSFTMNYQYKKHIETNQCIPPSKLYCSLCNKHFDRLFTLKCHMKSHDKDSPYRCDNCDMAFSYKSTLVRHMKIHDNSRPFKCPYCDKTFTSYGLIKPHLRKHTGERPYQCDVCLKRFGHKQNMERHKMRHLKEKKLVCEICNKKFPRESRLKYHMRTHLIDKLPFKCPLCHKSYSHRQNIQRHFKKKHPNDTYECTQTDAGVASIIWEALKRKEMEENGLPEEKNRDVDSDEEFLSVLKKSSCDNGELIIP